MANSAGGPSARASSVWKDVALGVLALAVLLLAMVVLKQRSETAEARPSAGDGETVAVFDLEVDRSQRRYLEILFDQPLGEERVGEVLARPPATLDPAVGGVWSWRDTHALRFEPTGRFEPATRYRLSLIPDRLETEGRRLTGETELTFSTDPFLVERVDVHEEPALEGGRNRVLFQGVLQFNYRVDPEELAPLIRVEDPGSEEPVLVELETSWRTTGIAFHTRPVEKLPEERTVEVVIDGSLTPADGNLPLVEDDEFRHPLQVGSSERLAVRKVSVESGRPDSRITLELSSSVEPSIVSRFMTIEPVEGGDPVRFRLSGARNRVVATGPFEPGRRYRLELEPGMPSLDDAVLQEPYVTEIGIPNLEPSLELVSDGMFLSRSGSHRLEVESVNVPRARLLVDRVYLNNLFVVFRYGNFSLGDSGYLQTWIDRRVGDRLVETDLELEGERNRPATTRIDLDDHLDLPARGLYRLTVQRARSPVGAQRWLLLTDLGVIAKRGDEGFDVWVSAFTDLSPVAGARVRLLSDQNQEMAAGRTDGSGRLTLPAPPPGASDVPRPYYLTVEKGDDFTFLLLDQTRVDTSGLDVGGASLGARGYRAFLYGERDLYRPGETVEGVAVLRDPSLEAPPPMPVTVRHRDPRGRLRDEWSLTSDGAGLAELALDLPSYALTGAHVLELLAGDETVGSWRFQVEEFVPDRIKVEIRPGAETGETAWSDVRVGPGEELGWEVISHYLFGPPAAELPVETRVRLVDDTFAPEGWSDYSFRNSERELDDREVFSREASLGEEGTATFATTLPEGAAVPSTLSAVITARVREAGGRGVTARTRLRVDPYPWYLGLKRPESYVEPGRSTALSWVAVTPDGEEIPGSEVGSLRADLYRQRWNTVLRRTPAGTYRYETTRELELVETKSVDGAAGRGEIEVVPPEFGSYKLVLLDPATAASASVSFYASGWGFAPWALENPARVELDLEKEEYLPGETAVVQVRTPFPGRLLLTVERGRVLHSQIHTLEGNTARLEVPVRGGWRPNVYVTATVVRSAGDLVPGEPGRAFGAVPLAVDRTSNRLGLEVDAPAEIRPETSLEVTVDASPGARVTVAAVDEGILQLIAQPTADPFSFFYRKLALGVATYDLFALLLPEIEGDTSAGGGEAGAGMAQYVGTEGIRRVEPVALWSGVLTAGGDGRVTTTFEVPRFQGALRVMAVALDGRTFGSTDVAVRVRDPLVLLPTAPRVLATGDRVELPVTVRNDAGRDGEIEVAFEAGGAASAVGETTRTVRLADGRETTVYFEAEAAGELAGAAEAATFRFRATGLGESTRAAETVPVRPALPPVRTEEAGAVGEATLELPAVAVDRYRTGTVTRNLHLGPVPLVSFSGHLGNLLRYPYGCLEQSVSRAFPLIYLEDLAKTLDPELFEEEGDTPAFYVQGAIRRVTDLQVYSGGFSLWPAGDVAHPWSSVYATHFLVEARRAGFPVDDFVLDAALDYLADESRAQGSYGSEQLVRLVYALYVLARADRPDPGTMDFLRERHRDAMSSTSRMLLAAAYAGMGDPRSARELAARIDAEDRVARQTGGNFASTLRNRALLLLALLDAVPDDPRIPDLVERLAREGRRVTRWTTQETAWVFLALGELYRRQEEKPAYAGTVTTGGREVADIDEEPVTLTNVGDGAVTVRMRAAEAGEGYEPGSAFYSLVTRGIPTEESFRARSEGLEIERRVLTREGRPADLGAVGQGDLLVVKTRVRSVSGPVENVVVENLLPAGLEVENPRLSTTETLPWVTDANAAPAYLDLRDDRILMFLDLPANTWQTTYALVRAVTPGTFRMPPPHTEAMYDPSLSATGPLGELVVRVTGGG